MVIATDDNYLISNYQDDYETYIFVGHTHRCITTDKSAFTDMELIVWKFMNGNAWGKFSKRFRIDTPTNN